MMTALPSTSRSGGHSRGMLACTAGWYAPEIPYSNIMAATSTGTRGRCPKASAVRATRAQVKKSNTTMILCLWRRSATTPPRGVSTTMGTNAAAEHRPNRLREPVTSSRYSGRTNRSTALPSREMICPITTKVKSR